MAGIDERNPYAAPGAEVMAAPAEAEHALRAPLWRRVLALGVDSTISYMLAQVVIVIMFTFAESGPRWLKILFGLLSYVLWFLCFWLYGAVMEWSDGSATLGKRIFGIRVVDLAGQPPGPGRCLARNLLKLASVLPYGLGAVTMLFTARRQPFHDWLAGTQVVLNKPPGPPSDPSQAVPREPDTPSAV